MTKTPRFPLRNAFQKPLRKGLGFVLAFTMMTTTVASLSVSAAPSTTDPSKVNISVSSHWVGQKAQKMDVSLLADGAVVGTATLDAASGWNYTFTDVPKTDATGRVIDYQIKEQDLPGYTEHVSGSEATGFDVVNLEHTDNPGFKGVPINVDVAKSWIGKVGTKADVVLLVDGYEAGTASLTKDDNWAHKFSNLPLVTNDNGAPVTYTIVEKNATGYDTIVSGNQYQGFTVSNIEANATPVEGSVVSKYVDTNGKEIAYRDTISGTIGSDYQTTAKTIPGYTMKLVTGTEKGTYSTGATEVVYVYERTDDKAAYAEGSVIAKFVDSKGVEIALRESISGAIASDYSIYAKAIPGYKLASNTTSSLQGKYEQGIKTVTFVYDEDTKSNDPVMGSTVAKYVDENGVAIADPVRTSGKIGDDYKTTQKSIAGYAFDRVTGMKEGKYGEGITTVEYVYKAIPVDSSVIVKYVDENGKELADRVTRTGKVGDAYTSEQKTINGYTFSRVDGDANGKLVAGITDVTYVYKLNTEKANATNPANTSTTDTGTSKDSTPTVSNNKANKLSASGKAASDTATNDSKENTDRVAKATPSNEDGASTKVKSDSTKSATPQDGSTTAAKQDTKEVKGKALADTATNMYNLFAFGAILVAIASVGFFLVNRRHKATDTE